MERKTPTQLELFSEIKSQGRLSGGASNSFFGYINKSEKTILALIGFIIVGITSFCLGLEKGKRESVKPSESPVSLQVTVQRSEEDRRNKKMDHPLGGVGALPRAELLPLQRNSVKGVALEQAMTFTIQLASYKTSKYAQKEAEALKRKGFSPFVVSRGDYMVVCVGNFSDKNVAKNMLAKLKKRYRDCYIRRL